MKVVIYTNRRADRILELAEDFPAEDWSIVWSVEEMEQELPSAEALVLSNRVCTPDLGEAIRRRRTQALKWVHFSSAGIERGISMGLPDDVIVTTSAKAKAPVCAEHAMTLLLASSRRLWDVREAQNRRDWARVELNGTVRSIEGRTLVIIGLGGIGTEIARKASAFDMRVLAVTRSSDTCPGVTQTMPRERMLDALAQADAVIVATASDSSSYRLIGREAFAAMKPNCYFINIARGEIVDETALVAALQAGDIAGAALDVTDEEPLFADSPLWSMPNVIVTPHISAAGSLNDYLRQKAIFEENLQLFNAGEPLKNIYGKSAGMASLSA